LLEIDDLPVLEITIASGDEHRIRSDVLSRKSEM